MSLTARMFVITICINLMLSLAGMALGGNDVVNKFLLINEDTGQVTPTDGYSGAIPVVAEEGFAPTGSVSFSFIDGLRMALNFFFLMIVSLFLPVYWGFHLGMPWFMTIILFIFSGLSMLSLIALIRGVSQ